jgi:hypothetical protein
MKYLGVMTSILIVLLTCLASASFVVQNVSLEKQYSGGGLVKGWINMSFNNQTNILFTNSFNLSSVSLLDLLSKSEYYAGEDYNCTPSNCNSTYSYSNGESTKSAELDGKAYGFVLTGKDVEIRDEGVKFKVSSQLESSCINQLKVDLFNDGSYEIFNKNYINDTCSIKNYGCFSSSNPDSEDEAIVPSSEGYCEVINLTAAPAYKVGARIKNIEGYATAEMKMYDYETGGELLGECTINGNDSLNFQNRECVLPYGVIDEKKVFLCIVADDEDEFYIKMEGRNPCGMKGHDPTLEFQQDYYIYAQSLKYGPANFDVNESSYESMTGESLKESVQSIC